MIVREDLMSAATIIVTELHKVHAGVSEVESFVGIVDGQRVRPEQFLGDQRRSASAVQPGALDAWILTPVWPEQVAHSANRNMFGLSLSFFALPAC